MQREELVNLEILRVDGRVRAQVIVVGVWGSVGRQGRPITE